MSQRRGIQWTVSKEVFSSESVKRNSVVSKEIFSRQSVKRNSVVSQRRGIQWAVSKEVFSNESVKRNSVVSHCRVNFSKTGDIGKKGTIERNQKMNSGQ